MMVIFSTLRSSLHSFFGVVAIAIFITGGVVFPSSAQDSKAEDAYEAAAGLFNLGLWEQAAAAYKEYFKKHPKHTLAGHAHYGLGLCYFNLRDYASAAKELESATASKGPDAVETNLYLGQALMMKTPAMPKHAEQAFGSSLKALGLPKKGLFEGKLFKREWNRESVTQWLGKTKGAEKKQLAADVFTGLLEATYLQGDWVSVVGKADAFGELIKGSRVEQRVRVLTGEAHEKSENYKEAAVAYVAAASLKGVDASEALFRLGLVRLNHLQDFEAAAKDFNEFTNKYKSDSKRPAATFNEALCYYRSYYDAGKKAAHLTAAIGRFNGFVRSNPKHELADSAQFYVGQLQHISENWLATLKALEPLMDRENPDFDQLVFLVADSQHHLGNWEKSAKFYLKFATGNEKALNADVALHNAGVAYSNFKKPDTEQAIAAFKLLEGKCPNSPHLHSARLKLGIIYYQAGRFEEAKKPLQKIPVSHVLKADADYWLAWSDLDNRKPVDAAKRFKALGARLAKTTPKHRLIPLANLYQGSAEFDGRRFTESVHTLSKFVSDFSGHEKLDEAAFNLGLAQMELEKWNDAIKSFEIVPEKSGYHGRALYQAAWSNRSAAKPGEAIPYYKALLEKHATSPLANNVALELAEVESQTGGEQGVANSVRRLTELLKKKPSPNVELRRLALWRLGLVQRDRKNYLESAKAFEDLLGGGAGNLLIQAAHEAGDAHRQASKNARGPARDREWKAALKNFEIAVQAKKAVPGTLDAEFQEQSLLSVGQCKAQLELWMDSQKAYELFIKSNPKHKFIRTAHLGLGWALQKQENYPGAITSFEKTVEGGKRDVTGARAQFLLGECYFEREQHDKAIIEFAKVESLYAFPQWQSKAAYELAQALLSKENRAAARQQFERLIKRYPDTQAATAAKSELKLLN